MLRFCLYLCSALAWASLVAAPVDWNPAAGLKAQPASLLQRPRGVWLEAGQDSEGGWYDDAYGLWGSSAWGLGFRHDESSGSWRPRGLWQGARALGSQAGLRLGWGLRVGPDERLDGGWIYRGQLGLEALGPWESDLSLALREIDLRAPAAAKSGLISLAWARDFSPFRINLEWQLPRQGRGSLFLGLALWPPAARGHFRAGLELREPAPRWWLSWGRENSDWLFDIAWSPGLGQNEMLNASIGLPLGQARQRPLPEVQEALAKPKAPSEQAPVLAVRMQRYGPLLVLIWDQGAAELGVAGFEVWSRVLAGASLIKAHSGLLHETQFKTELTLPGAQYGFQVRAVDAQGRLKAVSAVIEAGGP